MIHLKKQKTNKTSNLLYQQPLITSHKVLGSGVLFVCKKFSVMTAEHTILMLFKQHMFSSV